MKDYRGFVEGKYPEANERKTVQDFPPASSLFTYGTDFPMPESRDDLRCTYNEKEPIPPLELEDLRGFKVPPFGIVTVTANGMGLKPGWAGIVYGAGTFRRGESGINMVFGAQHGDMMIAREQARKDGVIDSLVEKLGDKGILVLDEVKDKDIEVIAGMMSWVFDKVDDDDDSRVALNLFKYVWDKVEHKTEVLDRLRGVKEVAKFGTASFDAMDKALEIIRKEREKLEAYEFVDVSVSDVD